VPADDLANLDAAQLARCFPREDDGRLPLAAVVLLAPVAPMTTAPKQRWLLAESPSRRSAPQVITLALRDETGRNFEHRWDEARWLWDARAAATTSELARWGTTWQLIEQGDAASDAAPPARAARALHLVRAGRWRDALALCGVTHALDELPYRRCNHGRGISPALWDRALEYGMRDVAPWRFAELVRGKTEQRLFNFPGQTTARKYCIVLRDDSGTPHLAVGLTGANTRLPAVRWRWPPDLALRVHGERALPLAGAPARTTARTASESELLAQIAADPAGADADDARRVLADLLTERGDSRGELIVLQLLPERDAKTTRRMRALVRAH